MGISNMVLMDSPKHVLWGIHGGIHDASPMVYSQDGNTYMWKAGTGWTKFNPPDPIRGKEDLLRIFLRENPGVSQQNVEFFNEHDVWSAFEDWYSLR